MRLGIFKYASITAAAVLSLTVSVYFPAYAADEDNYYNVLLDDESAQRFRKSQAAHERKTENMKFNAKNTIGDILGFTDFKPFAHLLMPNTKPADTSVTLDSLQTIMSIHHNISTENTLECLDYLARTIEKHQKVFFPIYSRKAIEQDPSLADTGMFFFRGKENGPFAVILPGGYSYKSTIHEGLPIAMRLAEQGYNAFVLAYRSGHLMKGSKDLITTINLIRRNADKLKVSKDNYSLWGAAVGAQLIINVTQNSDKGELKGLLEQRPAVDVFIYPLSFYPSQNDVPTVIVVGDQDKIVNKTILKSSINNLNKLGIESKFILMPRLQHGFGVGIDPNSSMNINWIGRAIDFWEEITGVGAEEEEASEQQQAAPIPYEDSGLDF